MGKMIAGKLFYGLVCLLAAVLLVVSGYAHKVVGLTTLLEKGISIPGISATGASGSVGAMNILVMGLESRTNYQGQTLPNDLLTAMHAGNAAAVSAGQLGSQDTNTLILIHVFAGGQKAVGFSVPRDDLVTYPQAYDGEPEGKIDGAYAYAYYQYLNQHSGTESSADRYLHANQAGQAATIATVQAVTGQHVDHFVEVNLAGFYYLAAAFGGIEACIEPAPASAEPAGLRAGANLTDADPLTGTDNSGFSAYKDGYNGTKGGAQYLHLGAAQSLAFVRSRDTLPGVDLGRTKRQLQAGHVEVLIGSAVTQVPAGIAPSPGTASAGAQSVGAQVIGARAAASPSASPSSTAGAEGSGTGDTVTVPPNAPYGIPCVY